MFVRFYLSILKTGFLVWNVYIKQQECIVVRIVGINIFDYKYVVIVLISIYGVGKIRFKVILVVAGIVEDVKISELFEG